MNDIKIGVDVKDYTTFGISAISKYFTEVSTLEQLRRVLCFARQKNIPFIFLGGGSNVLFLKDFEGILIKIDIKGFKEKKISENKVLVSGGAGESWDDFVAYCIDRNYGGLENLSLIPGNVGASPIQNIGAYGVEIKDTFYSLKAMNIETGKVEKFNWTQCEFAYRESFFKNKGKNRYVIIEVTYLLTVKKHNLNLSYGPIQSELQKNNIKKPTLKDIRNIVILIRKNKLPDPKIIGNAGSFFKNPVISMSDFTRLKNVYPEIPYYIVSQTAVKIPAAWLIEEIGWKGKKIGNVGVHQNQALVLVNYGQAIGNDILEISNCIIHDVKEKFSIQLQREVNLLPDKFKKA